jgi:hypothetical protein
MNKHGIIFMAAAVAGDFSSPPGKLRFLHRQTADRDIHFVANRTQEQLANKGVRTVS